MTIRGRRSTWIAVLMPWLLLLAGCASEVVLAPDVDKVKPKLLLNEGEFRVVRTVSGRASCRYFLYFAIPDSLLGVVGISRAAPLIAFALRDAALHVRAMEDLHSKHDLLGKPQILHHFVEEWTLANYVGLFAIKRLTITAEVLEFTGKGQ